VQFRRHNLMNATFPFKKPFDTVFCRNVMIYFDKPTRDGLVSRFHRHTVPGGYLLIGHSETLGQTNEQYGYVMPACYRKR
jgi:chemotaxis protein methyltransferase CheR